MSKLPIAIVLVIFGGLTLFVIQNSSVSLQLVFLGMPTLALPLGVWILLAVVAGAMTNWAIALLFNWSNYLHSRELHRRSRTTQSVVDSSSRQSTGSPAASNAVRDSFFRKDSSSPKTDASTKTNTGDWEEVVPRSSDWEDEQISTPERRNDGGDRELKDGDRAQSFYSYGSQNKSNSGVGKTEDVYEANYRVITPPYREEPAKINEVGDVADADDDWETSKSEEDDWGLDL